MKQLLQSEKNVMSVLSYIINSYSLYRSVLNLNHEDAIKKALETYNDFYQWLQTPGVVKR